MPSQTDQVIKYIKHKPAAELSYPFDHQTMVYKVCNKMFALVGHHQGNDIVNLKCDPDEALMLRDIFEGVTPGYHMNKRHWNTVKLDQSVPTSEIERMIDRSFSLIVRGLSKKQQAQLMLHFTDQQLHPK